MMDVNVDFLQQFINVLIKKTSGGSATLAFSEALATQKKFAVENENISNKELAEELHKPIIRKFNKRKIYSFFIDNTWGADLADMQLTSKFNNGVRSLLCVIDIFSKSACVIPFTDKKSITITKYGQRPQPRKLSPKDVNRKKYLQIQAENFTID